MAFPVLAAVVTALAGAVFIGAAALMFTWEALADKNVAVFVSGLVAILGFVGFYAHLRFYFPEGTAFTQWPRRLAPLVGIPLIALQWQEVADVGRVGVLFVVLWILLLLERGFYQTGRPG